LVLATAVLLSEHALVLAWIDSGRRRIFNNQYFGGIIDDWRRGFHTFHWRFARSHEDQGMSGQGDCGWNCKSAFHDFSFGCGFIKETCDHTFS